MGRFLLFFFWRLKQVWGKWNMVYVGMSTQHHLVLSCAWPELQTSGTRNTHRTRLGAENSTTQRHAQTNWMSSWKMVLQTVPCMIFVGAGRKDTRHVLPNYDSGQNISIRNVSLYHCLGCEKVWSSGMYHVEAQWPLPAHWHTQK